jgi:hypothetical protein
VPICFSCSPFSDLPFIVLPCLQFLLVLEYFFCSTFYLLFIGSFYLLCFFWLILIPSATGGRLWYYNGQYLPDLMRIIRAADKKNYMLQYYILYLMAKELNEHKVTEGIVTLWVHIFA